MSYVGVDIGGTHTKIARVSLTERSLLARRQFDTQACPDIGSFLTRLASEIRALSPGEELAGVGVGCPNANFRTGQVSHAANLPWKETVPLRAELARRLGCPAALDNDANVAALGEKYFGGARQMEDFIVITLGTGLGSGIFCNGQLVRGYSGMAGELGHLTFGNESRLSGYARKDAAETYLSASGLCRTYLQEMAREAVLPALPEVLSADQITSWAESGENRAKEALRQTGAWLGAFLAELVLFSSPEAIFLTGGLTKAGEILLQPAREQFKARLLPPFRDTVQLQVSVLPAGEAALLGAAALCA